MSNGTGQVGSGPTLAATLAAIGAARRAHTDAESAIFGAYATGQPFAHAGIDALIAANTDLNTALTTLKTLI
jgi:hypothetical protein